MTDTKSFWASKTIWGLILTLVCLIMSVCGHAPTDAQKADFAQIAEVAGALAGIILAGYGRIAATKQIGSAADTPTPPTVVILLVGALVAVAGCKEDATQIYGQGLATSTALHEGAHLYHVGAVAAGVSQDKRYQVEKQIDLVLQADQACVDSLKGDSTAYQAAKASGDSAAAAAATDQAKLAYKALSAMASRLTSMTVIPAPAKPAPTAPTTRPAG